MNFDLHTALELLGFLVSIGTILWKSGGQDQKLNQLIEAVQKNEDDTDKRFAATQGQISILQSQIMDVRENLAGNYMRKPEIAEIEKRGNDKQKEIMDTVREISRKVDKLLSGKHADA